MGDDCWRYVVRRLGGYTVLLGTDSEDQAVRFALKCDEPVKVIRTVDDEVIYPT